MLRAVEGHLIAGYAHGGDAPDKPLSPAPGAVEEEASLAKRLEEVDQDDWIDDIETPSERLDEYINAQKTATGFDLRYTGTMMSPEKDWREFTEVLSRRDLATLISTAWG